MPSNIFISYRREDAAAYAGRICDRLESAFGSEHVFIDVEDIAPGTDFIEAIDDKVGTCEVLVAVIGPHWLEDLSGRKGGPDYVEHEIASALRRHIPVIPVLVGGASMPSAAQLPASLAPLARRQALTVRDAGFDQDAGDLVRAIRRAAGGGRSAKRIVLLIALAGILIAVVGAAFFLLNASRDRSLNGIWIARMLRPGTRPYNIRLEFAVSGRTLRGQVTYPTGVTTIEGGTFEQGKLAFFTRHVPQFESQSVRIEFTGAVEGRVIQLTARTPDGVAARGTARKAE